MICDTNDFSQITLIPVAMLQVGYLQVAQLYNWYLDRSNKQKEKGKKRGIERKKYPVCNIASIHIQAASSLYSHSHFSAYLQQLDIESELRIGRDARGAFAAIAQARGDNDATFAFNAHASHANLPSFDNLACAKLESEWRAFLVRCRTVSLDGIQPLLKTHHQKPCRRLTSQYIACRACLPSSQLVPCPVFCRQS